MDRRRIGAAAAGFCALIGLVLAAGGSTAGATAGTLSLDAATFAFRHDSTHYSDHCLSNNNGTSSEREFQGTVNGTGAYFGSVNLPQGTTMRSLRLVARDNDADLNAHSYLLRKRMKPQAGLDGFQGYQVLAKVSSTGASSDLRRFTDGTVQSQVVNNNDFSYFVEIVNCGDTVDPIGVQVSWTRS